jgi:hypothetical protein
VCGFAPWPEPPFTLSVSCEDGTRLTLSSEDGTRLEVSVTEPARLTVTGY